MRKSTAAFTIAAILGTLGAALLGWMASGPMQSDPARQAELLKRLGEVGGAIVGLAIAVAVGGYLLRRRGK